MTDGACVQRLTCCDMLSFENTFAETPRCRNGNDDNDDDDDEHKQSTLDALARARKMAGLTHAQFLHATSRTCSGGWEPFGAKI